MMEQLDADLMEQLDAVTAETQGNSIDSDTNAGITYSMHQLLRVDVCM